MNQKTEDYNLLEEDWIPVLYSNGDHKRVGIRTALLEAGSIRQIAASNPMDRLAILRFLLALLYWCKGNPSRDVSTDFRDSFPADWFPKLDQNQDFFNLLGEGKRFYQCTPSGSGKSPETLPANYLVHEIPTGTNICHFRHSTDKVDGLCPACCAMGLLRLPLFATSGGRGKPPGINSKPPVYFIPTGSGDSATLVAASLGFGNASMGGARSATPQSG
jgi:CRISPR type I-E-associated protein CasA/Cse1